MAIVKSFVLDSTNRSEIPQLTNDAIEAARLKPATGCLIDNFCGDEALILSFAFRDFDRLSAFDFFGRIKKLESNYGVTFNKIFVRDVFNNWYHRGVFGLGGDVDQVTASLRTLIDRIGPRRLVTIGQSMGGYAAIMYGFLLGADQIIAFGPLSHLDVEEATRLGDHAFEIPMRNLRSDPPRVRYHDLVQLGRDLQFQGKLNLIFGTHPKHDDGVSSNFDAVHALRLAQLPNTVLNPIPESQHAVVSWLVDNGKMDDLLASLLIQDKSADHPPTVGAGLAELVHRSIPKVQGTPVHARPQEWKSKNDTDP